MNGRSSRLVAALTSGDAFEDLTMRLLTPVPEGPLDERPVVVDQTNTSVIVGERVVVKWMREPSAGARAPMLLEHLARTGFVDLPTPYAVVSRGDDLVAIVSAYLAEALDGWDWCVDALLDHLSGGASADFAAGIGGLAGTLHVALATASTVISEPIRQVTGPGWASSGRGVLNEACELARQAGDDDGRWLLAHADRLAAEIGASTSVRTTLAIHPHGDLHVGQVLKWRGGLAVTDFDGNPTLAGPALEPTARDIAQLRTSLLHVGEIANRRTDGRFRRIINEWGARSADELLYAYQRILKANGLSEIFDQRLLRAFEVEQECRELLYAARFLPRWRYAPMGVLRSWLGAEGES